MTREVQSFCYLKLGTLLYFGLLSPTPIKLNRGNGSRLPQFAPEHLLIAMETLAARIRLMLAKTVGFSLNCFMMQWFSWTQVRLVQLGSGNINDHNGVFFLFVFVSSEARLFYLLSAKLKGRSSNKLCP